MSTTGGVVKPSIEVIKRTKSLGTKLTSGDFQRVMRAALEAGKSPGEWTRDVVLAHLERTKFETVLLAEVLALRAIVANFERARAAGETLSFENAKAYVEYADRDKLSKAKALLGG